MPRPDEIVSRRCDDVVAQLNGIRESWDLNVQQEGLIDLLIGDLKLIKGHVEHS